MAEQVEVPAGQFNFRGSLPRSENNVLQPMLHPGLHISTGLNMLLEYLLGLILLSGFCLLLYLKTVKSIAYT